MFLDFNNHVIKIVQLVFKKNICAFSFSNMSWCISLHTSLLFRTYFLTAAKWKTWLVNSSRCKIAVQNDWHLIIWEQHHYLFRWFMECWDPADTSDNSRLGWTSSCPLFSATFPGPTALFPLFTLSLSNWLLVESFHLTGGRSRFCKCIV